MKIILGWVVCVLVAIAVGVGVEAEVAPSLPGATSQRPGLLAVADFPPGWAPDPGLRLAHVPDCMNSALSQVRSGGSAYFARSSETSDLQVVELAARFATSDAVKVYAETVSGIRLRNGSTTVLAPDVTLSIVCHEVSSAQMAIRVQHSISP